MDCGFIIQVDCDGLHTYVNPCDLIEECLLHVPQQLTKQCIVDFFNTTINTTPVWYFLRVNGLHCLEAVPLVINDHDELVWVNITDTPGYLWAKIVWSVTAWRAVVVSVIWPMGNQQVQIALNAPAWVLINASIPGCDGAYLRAHLNWTTYRDCDGGDNGYRATRYSSADLDPILTTNIFKSFFFTTSTSRWGTAMSNTPSMDIFAWETSMNWTGTHDGMIRIPKNGMYKIRMKGEAVINDWVSRIRLFLSVPKTLNPKILIDAKYWSETAFAWSFQSAPYQSNAGADGLEKMTVTLNWERLVYLEANDYVAMWCKIDTRYCNWVAPSVSWRHTVYELYDVAPGWASSEVPYAWPWISFWVEYYSTHNHWSVL